MTTFPNRRRTALLSSINGAAISLHQMAAALRARGKARRSHEDLRHLDPAIRADIGLGEGAFIAIR